MRNLILLLFALPLIVGCSPKPNISEIENYVTSAVQKCDGIVESVTLVREGILSYKFVGYAVVKVGERKFYPELDVYADTESAFWRLATDPCSSNELEGSVKELQRLLK
ncbi:MAG: hypothetical protein EBT07_14870 [Actinobacteria bacterium]|nr:hypothetical protein [Actinomycetota bacterium]